MLICYGSFYVVVFLRYIYIPSYIILFARTSNSNRQLLFFLAYWYSSSLMFMVVHIIKKKHIIISLQFVKSPWWTIYQRRSIQLCSFIIHIKVKPCLGLLRQTLPQRGWCNSDNSFQRIKQHVLVAETMSTHLFILYFFLVILTCAWET